MSELTRTGNGQVLKPRIFLGPTLSHDEAHQYLDADYHEPITSEDLPKAIDEGIGIVGIVDAIFITKYTASPSQILQCLRSGIVVFGAASAGALRAVETDQFGMRGVGQIYHLFKNREEDEEELLVAYDPDTLVPYSIAMINVRYALKQATIRGVIDEMAHDSLIKVAKEIYFAHRTWGGIIECCPDISPVAKEQLVRFLEEEKDCLDLKRMDAIECLKEINRFTQSLEAHV
ncbi:MAG: TfuA-like protein [bacterium]